MQAKFLSVKAWLVLLVVHSNLSLLLVSDEAEIRGHRNTYVVSGPGLVAQALRKTSCHSSRQNWTK